MPTAHSTGSGHVYQGRFKSFPIQDDQHFLTVCRYVEHNPLRAKLVASADDWRWSSLWRWRNGSVKGKAILSPWPVRRSPDWLSYVNAPQTENELTAVRRSVQRGSPLGDESWSAKMVKRLGLQSTLRPHGRSKKQNNGS